VFVLVISVHSHAKKLPLLLILNGVQQFESAESSVSDKQQSDDVKGDFGGYGLCRRTTFTGGARSRCTALHED
jgi:hypothetical protein